MGVFEDSQGQTSSSRQAQEEGADVVARVVVASIAALDKVLALVVRLGWAQAQRSA